MSQVKINLSSGIPNEVSKMVLDISARHKIFELVGRGGGKIKIGSRTFNIKPAFGRDKQAGLHTILASQTG